MLFTPIKPMIVSIGKEAFDDEQFIFEPKWDDLRILIHKQGEHIEATNCLKRSKKSVWDKFNS